MECLIVATGTLEFTETDDFTTAEVELIEEEEIGEVDVPKEIENLKLYIQKDENSYEEASEEDFNKEGYVKHNIPSNMKSCDYCFELVPKKATRCKHCHTTLAKKSMEEGENFVIVREETNQEIDGFMETIRKVDIIFKDQQMISYLRCYLVDCPELMDKEPRISTEDLMTILPNLHNDLGAYYGRESEYALYPILMFLEKEFEEVKEKYERMRKEGLVTFDMLRYLFPRSEKFFTVVDGNYLVGSSVNSTSYVRTCMGSYFQITCDVVKSNGDQFFISSQNFFLPAFRGVKQIAELTIQPMDDEVYEKLYKRGKKFNEAGTGSHYYDYEGPMLYQTSYYKTQWKADGRVMIDGTSFNKMNPSYDRFIETTPLYGGYDDYDYGGIDGKNKNVIQSVAEDKWYRCWHTLGGFSFRTKKWGEVLVENVKEITFDKHAFARLVLPHDRKKLIEALILNSKSTFTDIVSGKGGGCIFLLHGPPGTGKTLTAEAVAELLGRPLYSISVGELGVVTETLETTLRDILEVASVWDAVILIDEADIFLEKRSDNDIKRNALVGVFLRLLEYHQGILFLTTNRVKSFDEAFHSRISVALNYPALDLESRKSVWKNLLEAAGEANNPRLDVNTLASSHLNGRQIRTMIRLSQSLATSEGVPLSDSHFSRCISVATKFHDEVGMVDYV